MTPTIKNIIAAVVSAIVLASGAWAFSTEGRVSKIEASYERLERIEDKLDKVREEQVQVRSDLRRVINPPRHTERAAP